MGHGCTGVRKTVINGAAIRLERTGLSNQSAQLAFLLFRQVLLLLLRQFTVAEQMNRAVGIIALLVLLFPTIVVVLEILLRGLIPAAAAIAEHLDDDDGGTIVVRLSRQRGLLRGRGCVGRRRQCSDGRAEERTFCFEPLYKDTQANDPLDDSASRFHSISFFHPRRNPQTGRKKLME